MNKCKFCGCEADIVGGGCAIMMAFCRIHSTTLLNLTYLLQRML